MLTLLTVKQAAQQLGCSPLTVRRAIKDGSLRAVRLRPGSPYLIPEAELRKIMEEA